LGQVVDFFVSVFGRIYSIPINTHNTIMPKIATIPIIPKPIIMGKFD